MIYPSANGMLTVRGVQSRGQRSTEGCDRLEPMGIEYTCYEVVDRKIGENSRAPFEN